MQLKNINVRVGVDLGVTGALCLYDYQTSKIINLTDMPVTGEKRKALDLPGLAEQLHHYKAMGAGVVIIENVHAMPQSGSVAGFSMGYQKGAVQALCHLLKLPCVLVAPVRWKRHYELIKEPKHKSLDIARERFGEDYFKLQKHHNRAEAALIAALPWEVVGG